LTLLLNHVLTTAQQEPIEIPLIIHAPLAIQAARLALKALALTAFLVRILSISNLRPDNAFHLATQTNIHLLLS